MSDWEDFARSTMERYLAPRVGGHPPGLSLAQMAEHTHYHARLTGFTGDLATWHEHLASYGGADALARVQAAFAKVEAAEKRRDETLAVIAKVLAEEVSPSPLAQLMEPQAAALVAAADAPGLSAPPVDDFLSWLMEDKK